MAKTIVKIRVARRSDAEDIGSMALDFAHYLKGLGDKTRFQFNSKTYVRDGFGKNPAFNGLLAEVDGKPAGYLLYYFGYDTDRACRNMFMADLYVKEEYRRQEVGRALMARVMEICSKAGGKGLWWSVHVNNKNARGFYWHMGARYSRDYLYMHLRVK